MMWQPQCDLEKHQGDYPNAKSQIRTHHAELKYYGRMGNFFGH